MNDYFDRRQALVAIGAAATAGLCAPRALAQDSSPGAAPSGNTGSFRYCLNASTIRGQKLTLSEQIQVAATAGYQGIEPWLSDIHHVTESGGPLSDIKLQLADAGLAVESAIGFARWIVDDDQQRAQGLRDAERDMRAVAAIGGTRIAAPPIGASGPMDLDVIAERYHALLEVGARVGVVPQLELWGHSPAIHKLGQLMYIAVEAAHRDACLLPDVYHIYKGGSDFTGLRLIAGARMHAFHINDYPADPPRESIGDEHRVYPGDGVAPLTQILQDLHATGFRGALSLELFNRDYWKQDALDVAKTGLAKMKAAVAEALRS